VSRYHLPGCPREVSSTAHPFARLLSLLRVAPRPPVKGCLGSIRARPRFHRPCLSAPCGRDQRCVRPTFAIPHFKDEHPYFARLPTCYPELPPVPADERHGSRRAARFGRQLDHHTRRSLSQCGAWSAEPLTFPSPSRFREERVLLHPDDRGRFTAVFREFDG